MIRKFNYTGRERILREDVRILLKEEDSLRTFDASIDLDGYELPGSALVDVEAYRSGSPTWMRFSFGSVAKVQAPADLTLTEFDSFDGIKFRVRVTSVEEPAGLLLAEADRITLKKPEEEKENRVSLLPVVPDDLGDQLWRVDFEEEPSLLVNKAVGDWRAVSLSPGLWRSFTRPCCVRCSHARFFLRSISMLMTPRSRCRNGSVLLRYCRG